MLSPGAVGNQASMIATARVQPAEPPRTFTGKQLTMKPWPAGLVFTTTISIG